MISRAARVALLVVVLGSVACTGPELEEFLDLLKPVDLTQSDKPAEKAAGASADAVDDTIEAQRALTDALEDRKPEQLDRAVELRPRDPRFPLYRRTVNWITGNEVDLAPDSERALRFHQEAFAGKPQGVTLRRWREMVIDVHADVLNAYAADPQPARYHNVVSAYCRLLAEYQREYSSQFEGRLYLQFADDSRC